MSESLVGRKDDMSLLSIYPPDKSKFIRSPWLVAVLDQIESMEIGQVAETKLPPDIDFYFFYSELGAVSRPFEFGSLYNPKTRSVRLKRGFTAGEGGHDNPHVDFLNPRVNPDGSIDDILIHTHPWYPKHSISSLRDPVNACEPSPKDLSSILSQRLIEEEDGYERTVSQIISSGRHVCIMETDGIKLNEEYLLSLGIDSSSILELKRRLSLAPPVWITNYADQGSAEQLSRVIHEYYTRRRTDRSTHNYYKVRDLREQLSPLVMDNKALESLIDNLQSHLPEFPYEHQLRSMGIPDEYIPLVQSMVGLRRATYRVDIEKGLERVK